MGKTICLIGVGHIGGSMAITLKERGFADWIIGVDVHLESLDKALRRRIIDEALPLEAAVSKADVIVLAIPVDAMLSVLPMVLDLVERQVVLEVGSTKEQIVEAVRQHPKRHRFIATHPMAGTEYSGVEAAIPDLFTNKYTVLTNAEDSDPDVVQTARALYEAMQMHLVFLDAKAHDLHTAYVSHISHISAFALALTVLEKEKDEARIFELASSGFSSTVRLAKSSPEMWVPIFRQNRDFVMDVLDEHINQLARFRSLLIKKDFEQFFELIKKANSIKKVIE